MHEAYPILRFSVLVAVLIALGLWAVVSRGRYK